jgi:hypothetical protein
MKTRYLTLFFTLFTFFFLSSCKKTEKEEGEGTLNVRIAASFNNEAFAVGNSYINPDGYNTRIDFFKFYLSQLSVIKSDGTTEALMDIDLVDMADGPVNYPFTLAEGDYKGIQFGIGVPEEWNKDQDPTQYPNDHPLSVNGADGMFWTWNTGYIFTKVEGKADLEGGDDLISPFAFHCGEDPLFRTHVEDQSPFSISKDGTSTLEIHFHVEGFFRSDSDSIDIAIDNLTYTGGNYELAERFTNTFNEALEVR